MANLKSQGCGIRYGDGASPQVFTTIGQVVSISGPDGSASEIDVTNLQSAAKEFVIGLPDEGSVSLEVIFDYTNEASHAALHTSRANQTLITYQIFLSDSPETVIEFQAYCTTFSMNLGVDDKVGATFGLRITGAATFV